jgi:hypothetical protein
MTEGVLMLNWQYTHPSKIHVGIDECVTVHPLSLLPWFESIKLGNEKRGNALELGTHYATNCFKFVWSRIRFWTAYFGLHDI